MAGGSMTGGYSVRMTILTLKVLRAMLDDPTGDHYGLDLAKRAGTKIGSVYPILLRLEHAGWLTSHSEEIDPVDAGRPRRRLYRLTNLGTVQARAALEEAQRSLGLNRPGWAT